MARQIESADLASLIALAIYQADLLAEWVVAAHLNQALIALTGEGVALVPEVMLD